MNWPPDCLRRCGLSASTEGSSSETGPPTSETGPPEYGPRPLCPAPVNTLWIGLQVSCRFSRLLTARITPKHPLHFTGGATCTISKTWLLLTAQMCNEYSPGRCISGAGDSNVQHQLLSERELADILQTARRNNIPSSGQSILAGGAWQKSHLPSSRDERGDVLLYGYSSTLRTNLSSVRSP